MAEKLRETFVEADLLLFGQLELNEIHGSAEPLDERLPLFAPSGEPGIIILIGQVELVYPFGDGAYSKTSGVRTIRSRPRE